MAPIRRTLEPMIRRALNCKVPLWVVAPILCHFVALALVPDDQPVWGGSLMLFGWAVYLWGWTQPKEPS